MRSGHPTVQTMTLGLLVIAFTAGAAFATLSFGPKSWPKIETIDPTASPCPDCIGVKNEAASTTACNSAITSRKYRSG